MIYRFQSDDGRVLDIERPMARAPSLDAKITRGGVTYYRVPSVGAVRVAPDVHFMSSSLPRWCPGAKAYCEEPGPNYGKPLISGLREANAIEDATHGRYHYDRGVG